MVLEEWRGIEGYDNYSVSNLGRVMNIRTGLVLKPTFNNYHYIVGLHRNNRCKNHYIHRLVAQAFMMDVFGRQVKHVNGDNSNNAINNLFVDDRRAVVPRKKHRKILVVETGEIFDTVRECAEAVGGTPAGIYACMSGRMFRHREFHYVYIEEGLDFDA